MINLIYKHIQKRANWSHCLQNLVQLNIIQFASLSLAPGIINLYQISATRKQLILQHFMLLTLFHHVNMFLCNSFLPSLRCLRLRISTLKFQTQDIIMYQLTIAIRSFCYRTKKFSPNKTHQLSKTLFFNFVHVSTSIKS